MIFYALIFTLCLSCLFSCQSPHPLLVKKNNDTVNLYLDDKFLTSESFSIETEEEIFKLDDAMREMVRTQLTSELTTKQKAYTLLKHLFHSEQIALTYEGNANLTASQTYHAKIANCMSLTIMSYALAAEAGMHVSFREVDVPEYWVRNGQYNLLTGHVNLLITEEDYNSNKLLWSDTATVIDFDPYIAKKSFPTRVINKKKLLAMFYNNKGADALAANNYPLAYQYFKHATLADKNFSSAWGNLGVLYKVSGHQYFAEHAYIRSINSDPANLNSLNNLAMLLEKQGRDEEALPIENYIHNTRIKNPFYHALLANEASSSGAYNQAVKHYKKAILLDDEQHEFYFGLAKTYFQLGKLADSKKAMVKAASLTRAAHTQKLYVAKLNFLKVQENQSL